MATSSDDDDNDGGSDNRCQKSVDEDDPHNEDYAHRNCPDTAPCQDPFDSD